MRAAEVSPGPVAEIIIRDFRLNLRAYDEMLENPRFNLRAPQLYRAFREYTCGTLGARNMAALLKESYARFAQIEGAAGGIKPEHTRELAGQDDSLILQCSDEMLAAALEEAKETLNSIISEYEGNRPVEGR